MLTAGILTRLLNACIQPHSLAQNGWPNTDHFKEALRKWLSICRHEKLSINTYPLCYFPLSKWTQHSFAPLQKSRWADHRFFVWTEAISRRYGFRAGAKDYLVHSLHVKSSFMADNAFGVWAIRLCRSQVLPTKYKNIKNTPPSLSSVRRKQGIVSC